MRRTVDIVVAALLGVLLTPFLLLVAIAVRVRMGRPVLFRQARSGRDGKIFRVVKFRTMRDERYPGEPDNLRTPPLGLTLRACSIDELPQLWNILRGQMSLIGPRPTLPEQVARYSERERGRLAVRPGLTGWAQVNGRNGISWHERIELDLWYLTHRSPTCDLRILWRTAKLVIRRHGVLAEGGNPDFRPAVAPTPDNAGPSHRPTAGAPRT